MSVLLLVRFQIAPEQADRAAESVAPMVEAMRRSSGWLWADAAVGIHDREAVTLVAEWRTASDLEAFTSDAAWQAFLQASDAWVREAPSIRRFSS